MEMEKVPAAGYRIEGLPISGLKRKLDWSNVLLPFKALSSLLKARTILRKFKPQVAVGVGGYASGPLLFAASLMRIHIPHPGTEFLCGVTNKLLVETRSENLRGL
jgi:UDP-N-acetylglucosamine--N-acetylmuramyl-(pentapeptide) pyrophosphoryl-undecaprenol N-acetylglucosamine transferase